MRGAREIQGGAERLPASASLADHASFFFRMATPFVMLAALLLLVGLRLVLRDFTNVDLWLLVGLIAAYPLIEWLAHRVVLHWQPRTVFGRTIDIGPAVNHRAHHVTPNDLTKSVPDTTRNLLIVLVGAAVPTFVILHDAGPRVTVLGYVVAALLAYEWTHYLIHSTHRPRGRLFRRLRRNHLLHHYRNEKYWFGVVAHSGDVLLRTDPSPDSVPRSPTARTLDIATD